MSASTSLFRRHLLIVSGIVISLLFLYLAVRHLELARIVRTVTSARSFPWLPLAVASYLVGHLVRGARCRLLVSRDASLPLLTACNIVVLGYAVNNILPARLGEFARAGLLAERTGLPYTHALTVTFTERLMDGLVLLVLLGLSLGFIPAFGILPPSLFLIGGIFALATVALLLAVLAPHMTVRVASLVSRGVLPFWHDGLVRLAQLLTNGVSYLRAPRQALYIVALSVAVWLFETGMFVCLMPMFGIEVDIWLAFLALTLTYLAGLLPLSPGFVAPYSDYCMQALVLVGLSHSTALSYAVMAHAAFYIPVTLWGVAVITSYSIEFRATEWWMEAFVPRGASGGGGRLAVTRIASISGVKGGDEVSRFMRSLAGATVPLDDLALHPEEREAVEASVARFLRRQIGSLPFRLRMLLAVALAGFRVLVFLRHLTRFEALPLERRTAIVEAWAYGRLRLARQMFRPIRSTALLAFYEEEAVRARLRGGAARERPSAVGSPR